MVRARVFLAAAVACAAAACGGGHHNGDDAATDGTGTGSDGGTIDAPSGPDAMVSPACTPTHGTQLKLTQVATGLENPVTATAPAGDSRLFIVEQPGRIRVVKNGVLLDTPFLTVNVNDLGLEQGLLGLAFHPQFAQNGRFFVLYTLPGMANLRLAEYHADPTSDVADPTEKIVLDLSHPYENDNSGTLDFGRDGFLYLSIGDGGGHNNFLGYAQRPDIMLAKILRLDVDHGATYSIPADNPWATMPADQYVRETWAWGLRNPWRISIDRGTGDLWISDVGEGNFEEIDVVRHGSGGGQNFGWAVFEGPMCFTADPDGNLGCDMPQSYVAPVYAYDRTQAGTGCVGITGGVYRGGCMPDLDGQLFFGDYCIGHVSTFPATSTSVDSSGVTYHSELDPQHLLEGQLVAFGHDGFEELYPVARNSGTVYRIEVQ